MRQNQINILLCVTVLFVTTALLFQYSVKIRKPWFGELSLNKVNGYDCFGDGHHSFLTGSTLKFTKNWLREGAWSLKFGMFENPKSVEFNTLESRKFYSSYPPGAIIPIYIISKVTDHEPTPSMVMQYNLINHFLIALFLSLTTFFFLSLTLEFHVIPSILFSIIPSAFELLLPGPLYWHQNVFFSDQAVILPYVLIIFLEVIRGNFKNRNIINLLQGFVMFYAFLTDWFSFSVCIIIYLKRIMAGELSAKRFREFINKSLKYWLAPLIAILLFTLQLYLLNGFQRIIDKFLERTAISPSAQQYVINFNKQFWGWYISINYGYWAKFILWGGLFLFVATFLFLLIKKTRSELIDKDLRQIVSFTGMLLIPSFLHTYLLKNHSFVHDFSALKYSIPFAVIPFVLIPVIFLYLLKLRFIINKSVLVVLAVIMLVISGIYLNRTHPAYKNLFPPATRALKYVGMFVNQNTSYGDIVFSPNFNIPANPPQLLSYSMKRVYKINSKNDIYERIRDIDENYEVNILLVGKYFDSKPEIKELLSTAYDMKQVDGFEIDGNCLLTKHLSMPYDMKQVDGLYLYKIRKNEIFKKFIGSKL